MTIIKNNNLLILLVILLFVGCESSSDSIFTHLDIRVVMADNEPIDELNVVVENSYFTNINTYERIGFPPLKNNIAQIKLRKGVYTLILEVEAKYLNGNLKLLRNADYNQSTQALTWVGESESIVLLLKSVN